MKSRNNRKNFPYSTVGNGTLYMTESPCRLITGTVNIWIEDQLLRARYTVGDVYDEIRDLDRRKFERKSNFKQNGNKM
jgi:hypothetical protein